MSGTSYKGLRYWRLKFYDFGVSVANIILIVMYNKALPHRNNLGRSGDYTQCSWIFLSYSAVLFYDCGSEKHAQLKQDCVACCFYNALVKGDKLMARYLSISCDITRHLGYIDIRPLLLVVALLFLFSFFSVCHE